MCCTYQFNTHRQKDGLQQHVHATVWSMVPSAWTRRWGRSRLFPHSQEGSRRSLLETLCKIRGMYINPGLNPPTTVYVHINRAPPSPSHTHLSTRPRLLEKTSARFTVRTRWECDYLSMAACTTYLFAIYCVAVRMQAEEKQKQVKEKEKQLKELLQREAVRHKAESAVADSGITGDRAVALTSNVNHNPHVCCVQSGRHWGLYTGLGWSRVAIIYMWIDSCCKKEPDRSSARVWN